MCSDPDYPENGLLVAAIAGKLACGLGVRQQTNRLAIGLGMMPRGEVGLSFAAIGKGLNVINDALFFGHRADGNRDNPAGAAPAEAGTVRRERLMQLVPRSVRMIPGRVPG